MSLKTLPGNRIIVLWFGVILLALAVIRLGDRLAIDQGRPTGFYVGSLFIWIIWVAWLVSWRWIGARQTQTPARRWRWLQLLLAVFGVIWLSATVLEYL